MRPREILANWLLCATLEAIEGRKLMFYSDPVGGVEIIRDEATEQTWPTEHVYVSQYSTGPDAKALILDAIKHKQSKGEPYCRGKTLIVFLDTPRGRAVASNRGRKGVAEPAALRSRVGCRFFHASGRGLRYGLTMLDPTQENAPLFCCGSIKTLRLGSGADAIAGKGRRNSPMVCDTMSISRIRAGQAMATTRGYLPA